MEKAPTKLKQQQQQQPVAMLTTMMTNQCHQISESHVSNRNENEITFYRSNDLPRGDSLMYSV
jgi:hypothetical protein